MLWLWISIYIVIGAASVFAYIGKYENPRVRIGLGMQPRMSMWELVFIFFFWPLAVVISVVSRIL